MRIIDAYGDFDLPEEKSVVEVVEDPAKVILSTYQMFYDICSRKLEAREYPSDKIFSVANDMLKGKESLKLNDDSVKEILKEIGKLEENYFYLAGAFLSAMHNAIDLKVLTINEKTRVFQIGKKLKQGKTLVLGHDFTANYIGYESEGNILNYGAGGNFAPYAKGGIKIDNKGITLAGEYSTRFEPSLAIYNAFELVDVETWCIKMKNVTFLPWEKGTLEIREYEKNGMPEKKYELHELIQPYHHKSHLLYPENLASVNSPTSQKLLNILAKLEQFLAEDSALAKLRTKTTFEQADEIVKQMKKYDVKGLEHEIDKFAGEILDIKYLPKPC